MTTGSLKIPNACYIPYQRLVAVSELWYRASGVSELACNCCLMFSCATWSHICLTYISKHECHAMCLYSIEVFSIHLGL